MTDNQGTHTLNRRVCALIKLLEDPNEIVYDAVRHALLKEDFSIVPVLEEAWDNAKDDTLRYRISDIIHRIQYKSVCNDFIDWMNDDADDLLYGAYLVAKYQYPELEFGPMNSRLNAIWRILRTDVGKVESPREKIKVINDYFFGKLGITKNYSNPASHRNNCLNDVLETLKGNHVTLSIIYTALCQKMSLPVGCVSLPKIVIVCYMDTNADMDNIKAEDVMFYINPANNGKLLNRTDITTFLDQYNLERESRFYVPCDNVEVVRRLLTNMMYAFEVIGHSEKSREVSNIVDILDNYENKK